MLPFGHTAVGYLISQTAKPKLNAKESWLIIAAANIFDLDFFVLPILGITGGLHHYFPGHTPLMGLIYWLILYLIFGSKFSKRVFLLVALALLSHLVIDDFSHWLALVGLEKNIPSQINWFYPFTKKEPPLEPFTNIDVLKIYLFQAPKLFYLEIVSIIMAIVIFLREKRKNFVS